MLLYVCMCRLIELCACRDVRINHQQVKLLLAVLVMHSGDQHVLSLSCYSYQNLHFLCG